MLDNWRAKNALLRSGIYVREFKIKLFICLLFIVQKGQVVQTINNKQFDFKPFIFWKYFIINIIYIYIILIIRKSGIRRGFKIKLFIVYCLSSTLSATCLGVLSFWTNKTVKKFVWKTNFYYICSRFPTSFG